MTMQRYFSILKLFFWFSIIPAMLSAAGDNPFSLDNIISQATSSKFVLTDNEIREYRSKIRTKIEELEPINQQYPTNDVAKAHIELISDLTEAYNSLTLNKKKNKPHGSLRLGLLTTIYHTCQDNAKLDLLRQYIIDITSKNEPRVGAAVEKQVVTEVWGRKPQISLGDAQRIDARAKVDDYIWVPTATEPNNEYHVPNEYLNAFMFPASSQPGLVRWCEKNIPLDITTCMPKYPVMPAVQCYWNEPKPEDITWQDGNCTNHATRLNYSFHMRVSNDLTGTDVLCAHPDNPKDEVQASGSTMYVPPLIAGLLIDNSPSHAAMTYNKKSDRKDPSFVDGIAAYQLRQSQRQYTIDDLGYIDVQIQKYTHQPCYTMQYKDARSCITALSLCQLSPLVAYSRYDKDESTLTITTLPRQRYTTCMKPYWFFWSKEYVKKETADLVSWKGQIPGKVVKIVQAGYGNFLCLTEDKKLHAVRFDKKELVCDSLNELLIKVADIAFDKKNNNIALLDCAGNAYALGGKFLFSCNYKCNKDVYNECLFGEPLTLNTQHLIPKKSEFNNPQNNGFDNFTEKVKLLDQRLYYHDGVIDIWNQMGSYFDAGKIFPVFRTPKKEEERNQEDTPQASDSDNNDSDGDIENQSEEDKKYNPFGYIVTRYTVSSDQVTHK